MKKNVAKILRASLPERGKILKEIGIDGFSVSELNYLAGKFGIYIPLENTVKKNSIEVSSKKYKYEMLLNALTI